MDFVFESNYDSLFCIFKSLIGTDMTYQFSVDVPLKIKSIYLSLGPEK